MRIKDYCGIFGISCNDFSYSVSGLIYSGLMALQHRGQKFSGISVSHCDGKIDSYKDYGLVSKVLNRKKLKIFSGNVGIGHVCYGGPNCNNLESAQPYHFKTSKVEFSIAMNGIITNYHDILQELKSLGRIFTGNSHIELLATLITTLYQLSEDIFSALMKTMKLIKGAYSLSLLTNEGLIYALRDPLGYKPLCYGGLKIDKKKYYILSSESCAIEVIGGKLIGDVKPGEIIKIDPIKGFEKHQILKQENFRICQYEYVYFARPDSIIDGNSVAKVRYNLGKNLAKDDTFNSKNAIVVPVPDSGRSAAMGYSWESKIPYEEGLMKNRYMWQNKVDVSKKLNPIKTVIKNKDIILIDDSIISGNTMKKIVSMLKKTGALSVHVRISCPPIIKNCELNSIFSNEELLVAYKTKVKYYNNFNEEMRRYIDADSLKYQSITGLIDAIGLDQNRLCIDCLQEYCNIKEDSNKQNLELLM